MCIVRDWVIYLDLLYSRVVLYGGNGYFIYYFFLMKSEGCFIPSRTTKKEMALLLKLPFMPST